jgi:hypothetical protein
MVIHRSLAARVATLALAAALTTPTLVPTTASAASLKPLVAQASEIANAYGSGFKTLGSRPMRPSDLRGITAGTAGSAATLTKGFVGGYFSSFYRSSLVRSGTTTSLRPGVSLVSNGVSLFRNAAYSSTALELAMKNRPAVLKALRQEHVTDVSIGWFNGVGEKAIMMNYAVTIPGLTPGSKPFRTQAITLIFSRGKFASTLNISGTGSISTVGALAIAKHVDDRLQHAG